MIHDHELDEAAMDQEPGRIDRRTLLRRGAVLGLSVPVVASLLAACGDDDEDEPEATTAPSQPDPTATDVPDDAEEEPEDEETEEESAEPTATTEEAEDEETEEPTEEETAEEEEDDDVEEMPAPEGTFGGTLKVALIGEPPTLDIHQTTATIVSLITWHMYECLFTYAQDFSVVPQLAESYEVSDDGLTNTIVLRNDVTFHNGEPMVASDVVASIERWAGISGLGAGLLESTANINVIDDYTIEFEMNETVGSFAVVLARANQGAAIYPASVIEAAGDEPMTEFVGTGPYMLVDRQADRFIRFARFDDYVSSPGETNGYAGFKAAYLDEIEFIPVPDESARLAGLQAGDYDYLESIVADQMAVLEGNPDLDVGLLPPSGWDVLVFNTAQGIMTDQKLRQAVQATIDCEPIMLAAEGEGFFRLDPGMMLQETVWHSLVGEDRYNMANPELGAQLLAESNYAGEPVRFLTTQEYADQYATAVVSKQQLEEVGIMVELIVTDWATLIANRAIETEWDIFTTGFSFRVDPIGMPPFPSCTWPGWWCTDEKVEVVGRLGGEMTFEARYQALEELQELWYSDVPGIKVADTYGVNARSARIKNFVTLTQLQPEFVNIWLED